jgi:hypothetical protein
MSEPSWLTEKIDRRLALMESHIGNAADVPANLVMTPLTEPLEHATKEEFERWERTCDHCGTYCSAADPFYTGHSVRMRGEVQVVFVFGVCASCKKAGEQELGRSWG